MLSLSRSFLDFDLAIDAVLYRSGNSFRKGSDILCAMLIIEDRSLISYILNDINTLILPKRT